MSTEWYFGLTNDITQTPEHAPAKGFDSVTQYWIGRSCGCKLRTIEMDVPYNSSGIVVYPGIRFEEKADSEQHIKHLNTKNGPLTICSNLCYRRPS